MPIDGAQLAELKNRIVAEVPSQRFLDAVGKARRGQNAEYAGLPDYRQIVDAAFEDAESDNWLHLLLFALGAEPAVEVVRLSRMLFETCVEQLQNLDDADFRRFQWGIWGARLPPIQLAVCQIEIDGNPAGTGFLVGDDLVLTAAHTVVVMELCVDDEARGRKVAIGENAHRLKVRFDFGVTVNDETGSHDIRQGTLEAVHADWLVRYSDPHPNERDRRFPPTEGPAFDKYDYALVRLARSVGKASVPGSARPRKWIPVNNVSACIEEKAMVAIAQHAGGQALEGAIGRVSAIPQHKVRALYNLKTAEGSSGSPCWDRDLNLIALHNFGGKHRDNQGVPIQCIVEDLFKDATVKEALDVALPQEVDGGGGGLSFQRVWELGARYPILGRQELQKYVFEMFDPESAQLLLVRGLHGGREFTAKIVCQMTLRYGLRHPVLEISVATMRNGPAHFLQSFFDQFRWNSEATYAPLPMATDDQVLGQLEEVLAKIRREFPGVGGAKTAKQVWLVIDGADLEGIGDLTNVPVASRNLVIDLLQRLHTVPGLRVVLLLAGELWQPPPEVVGYREERVSNPLEADIVAHLRFASERMSLELPADTLAAMAASALATPNRDNSEKTLSEIATIVQKQVQHLDRLAEGQPNAAQNAPPPPQHVEH